MNIKEKFNLTKKCPNCKQKTVIIQGKDLICENPDCNFHLIYACPICDKDLKDENFHQDEKGDYFHCTVCNNNIYVKRIHYLIENSMIIDHKHRCGFCNGPTIHRPEANLAYRCIFFPGCSGQVDLFGNRKKESLVFLDFETTGLDQVKNEIIEIGALKIDSEGYEHTFEQFVKPLKPLDPYITKLTGITSDMLEGAIDISLAIKNLKEFIADAIIIAHNADFDLPWYVINLKKNKIEIGDNQIICTLEWAKRNGENSKSLGALTKKYNIGHVNAHRALADAVATKELFFIYENMRKTSRPVFDMKKYIDRSDKILNQSLIVC